MENAARALEMAGGILVAILIISLFTYMFNSLSQHQAVITMNDDIEKLETFNAKYLAYNKTILYGADIISVINMALSNNVAVTEGKQGEIKEQRKYSAFDSHNPYSINIKFKLLENGYDDIRATIYKIPHDVSSSDVDINEMHKINDSDISEIDSLYIGGVNYSAEKLSLTKEALGTKQYYDLELYKINTANGTTGNYAVSNDDGKFANNAKILNANRILSIMPGDNIKLQEADEGGIKYDFFVRRETARFVKKIFKCTKVEFSETTGRVREMTFEEFNASEVGH